MSIVFRVLAQSDYLCVIIQKFAIGVAMEYSGNLIKMISNFNHPVDYLLSFGDEEICLNGLLGKINFIETQRVLCENESN